MRKTVRNIEGMTPLEWLRRALPEVAIAGLSDPHTRVLHDPTLPRVLKRSLRRLRAEVLDHCPVDETQLGAIDRIAAELRRRSHRRRPSLKDAVGAATAMETTPPGSEGARTRVHDSQRDPLDAVLTAIAGVPLRTPWEWFRQQMQLANALSFPERGRAATAAGRSLAQDTATALAKFNGQGASGWVLGAQVVADLESRLAALALRDTRESCDPLTPRDVGQVVLDAIVGRAGRELEGSPLDTRTKGKGMQGFRPIGDEKCPRCGHDPESCFRAFADEDA